MYISDSGVLHLNIMNIHNYVINMQIDSVLKSNEEFPRKTSYIHVGQFEIFEI